MSITARTFKYIILFACIFSIPGCALKPFFGKPNEETAKQLQQIEVIPLNTIPGAEFYSSLQEYLRPDGSNKYQLHTEISCNKTIDVLLSNSDTIRDRSIMFVKYRLIDSRNLSIVTEGKFTRSMSYSTTFAPYSNTTRSEDSMMRLAKEAAETIRNRLIIFFTNQELAVD